MAIDWYEKENVSDNLQAVFSYVSIGKYVQSKIDTKTRNAGHWTDDLQVTRLSNCLGPPVDSQVGPWKILDHNGPEKFNIETAQPENLKKNLRPVHQ